MSHSTEHPVDLMLQAQAGEWFLRRRDEDWTDEDEASLQHWLNAAPENQSAFARVTSTWSDFAEVPRPAIRPGHRDLSPDRASLDRLGAPPAMAVRPPAPSRAGRRWLVPAAIACAALFALGGWHQWDNTPRYALDIHTAPGETRQVDLPDGSRIDLNFSSTLHLRYYPRRREVALDRGEAFFTVAPDPSRPFSVDSGPARVTVLGTSFNVRSGPPRIEISVLEGQVLVEPDRAHTGRARSLRREEALAIDPSTGRFQAFTASAEAVGDWRSGRLVFRRARLEDVARELGRYLGEPVVLQGNDELRQLWVSGYASTQAPAVFLSALPDLLPVRVNRSAGQGYLITRR